MRDLVKDYISRALDSYRIVLRTGFINCPMSFWWHNVGQYLYSRKAQS